MIRFKVARNLSEIQHTKSKLLENGIKIKHKISTYVYTNSLI